MPNLAREIVRGNKKPTAAAAAGGGDGSSAAVVTDSSSSDSSSSEGSVSAVGRGDGHLNLKGFFVGNAWTDAAIDNRGRCQQIDWSVCEARGGGGSPTGWVERAGVGWGKVHAYCWG